MVPIPPTTDETELAGESQGQEVSGKREKGEVLFSWYNRGISRKQPGWKEGQGGSMQVGDPHQMNGKREAKDTGATQLSPRPTATAALAGSRRGWEGDE